MSQKQKLEIEINDPKVIKAIKKPFAKQIIECFYNTPLSASDVAVAVSFPKDKIYYHIKKLLAIDILFIADSEKVKGIVQNRFLPTAQKFIFEGQSIGNPTTENEILNRTKETSDIHESIENNETQETDQSIKENESNENISKQTTGNPLLEKLLLKRSGKSTKSTTQRIDTSKKIDSPEITEKAKPSFKRTIDDRRRSSDRRFTDERRANKDRRVKQILNYEGKDKREKKERRSGKEQRSSLSRREAIDRRLDIDPKQSISKVPEKNETSPKDSRQSQLIKNAKLHLDGVTHAISFVHTGNNVTFMQADLGADDFQIKHVINYRLPILKEDDDIKTLPDLISNVYEQFIKKSKRKNIYLAIHSDGYQYEMTYVNTEDHKKGDFNDFLLYTLTKSYSLDTDQSLVVYDFNDEKENNAVVCYSPYKKNIEFDYTYLIDTGLQPRYNTSIPKILHNLYNYYKNQVDSGNALLIYISNTKTHMVLLQNYQLVESRDFSIGLDHFMDPICKMIFGDQWTEEEIRNKAMDFLDRYGIALPETKPSELNILPWDEAQEALNRLAQRLQTEIKSSKTYFRNIRETMGNKRMIIGDIYLGGPGSHIKNMNKLINQVLESPIKKLETLNTASIKKMSDSKTDLLTQLKEKNLNRKKKNAESILDEVRDNIMGHKKAIETATSPESVKYRLARLEIDKNSKTKSIEEATDKLIRAATDFKELKDDYTSTQETLSADLETITGQLDTNSEGLMEKYREHEYLVKQISKMEYETDQFQKKRDVALKESKGNYAIELKKSANVRVSLAEQKNELEHKVGDQQAEILKGQENLHKISIKLEDYHDEVTVMEYLIDTVDNTSNALRKSFLTRLKSLDTLEQSDFNELEQAGYLITLNKKRLNSIRKNFTKMVSGESESASVRHIDVGDAFEIWKKLIVVLDGLLSTPDNLDQIKKIIGNLIKINEEYKDLDSEQDRLKKRLNVKSRSTDKEERKLSILKKNIDFHNRNLKNEEIEHRNMLASVEHVQDAISEIDPLISINEIKKQQQHQQQQMRKELTSLQNQITRLVSAIVVRKQKMKGLKTKNSKMKKENILKIKKFNQQIQSLVRLQEKLKKLISENSQKENEIDKEIKVAVKVFTQTEKQLLEVTKEYKNLQIQERALVREAKKEQTKLNTALKRKINKLDKEQDKKTSIADKKRKLKVNAFMSELKELTKKEKSIQDLMNSSTSEIQKKQNDRERAKDNLVIKKKKILPQIAEWQKQIKSWNRSLKRFYSIQQKFDVLEEENTKWQTLLDQETENTEEQVKILEGHIAHKQSDSYLLLVQEGLNRFNNEADAVLAAKQLAKESIALDQDEIKKLNQAIGRLKNRHKTFTKRYKIKRKNFLNELRPYRGREKTIRNRIISAQRKIISAEEVLNVWKAKLDTKNDILSKIEVDFLKLQEKANLKLNDIQMQIEQCRSKETKDQATISSELEDQWGEIIDEKTAAENQFLKEVQIIDEQLKQKDVIINKEKFENDVWMKKEELKTSKERLDKLIQKQKKTQRTIMAYKRDLDSTKKKIPKVKTDLKEQEQRFQVYSDEFKERTVIIEKELTQKKENQITTKKLKYETELKLRKIKKDFEQTVYESKKIEKKILILTQKAENLTTNSKQKVSKSKKIISVEKQNQKLINIEEKCSKKATQLEKNIQKLDKLIASDKDLAIETEKIIDELKQEIQNLTNDLDKTVSLLMTNRENLIEIGEPHLVILERLSHLKDIYPATKAMLREHIEVLYTTIAQKTKDKKKLDATLMDMEANLQSRKVDMAMLEKELTKINKNMKKVLEYSLYDQDPTPKAIEIKLGDTEYKLRSYMDLAELKARSQDLFEEIIQGEQDVARLQKKLASIQHVQSETEQISQKKIKRMEEDCKKLELQIAKEKNEVEELEKSLKDLAEHTSNYSDRIEILEEELKKFREKETKNEILLRDLDRSLEQIQDKAQQMVFEESTIKENTIELDYMANLGLLMDTDSKLNILPEKHKKEYRYFGINRILQNALVILVTVFTFSAYAQRSKVQPLEESLPDKYNQLSLLKVRQDVKQILEKQVMVADAFQVLIDEDKALSTNMVSSLKYLSNSVPENFRVTNLILDKDVVGLATDDTARSKIADYDDPMFIIVIDGFYNHGMGKATKFVELFKNSLISNENFKVVYFSPGKAVNKWKTSFSINIVL